MAHGHGPTTREEEILALAEGGAPASAVAARLGLGEAYVGTVLSRMRPSPCNRAFEDMVAKGSRDLLRALCQHHPDVAAAARAMGAQG